MKNEGDYKPIKGINRLKNYVVEKVIKENCCLVIGSRELIDKFSDDCGINVDFLMTDMLTFDNQTESVPMKVYNRKSKEVLLCCLADKNSLVNVVTQGMTENIEDAKDLVAIFLRKEKYKGGYIFNADSRCAKTEKEKIKIVGSLFRVPDNKTKHEMTKLLKDRSVLELDRFFDQAVKNKPHGEENETFLKSLGIDDSRYDYLQEILIRLSGKSTSAGKLAGAEEIDDMDHEKFLDLLEKEKGLDSTEMLYLAFSQGALMQKFSAMINEQFFHLEEDNDERLKSIGKRHSCEVRKSDTIFKIENLNGLNLREKLKSTFWAGNYNEKFYGEEKDL
jgi:hypothetical protein